jgi:dTDP-4-dehydrorhamnose reductase
MKILITAKNGQLGHELQNSIPKIGSELIEVLACDSSELNITNQQNVFKIVNDFKPDVVINAAAYTAVDKAETDSQACYAVNESGVKNLALACKQIGAKLIHVSTDFVFDATQNTPYQPMDKTNPLGVYGASKLAGEKIAQEILKQDVSIVRTAWVYSSHGNNFVKTMLRLMAEKPQLGVVSDQIGTPTAAKNLAAALWKLAARMQQQACDPIYHWTDLGTTSWYDFAVAIQEIALTQNKLTKEIPILPIKASQYPTPAKRPAYSVLDTSALREQLNIQGTHWQKALSEVIAV